MVSSTAEADLEAQSRGPLPANDAGVPSTDITPNPQPPPNRNPRVTNINDPPNAQTAKNLEVQRDENHGDSSDGLWSIYLTEAEKQDKEVTDSWKGDTEGILVFTGLFSATVATFITESLQNLTPDPSDQTNALLAQISQQLVNISNGTPLASAATQISQSFTPTPSAVRVNILWFLSLILSLSCALSATLMQQWARRYQELAQRRGAFHRRGRMRAYIFDGINRFKMARVVAAMPKLLHTSVFLFFAGVVDFLFPIYPTLAYATLGCIMAFALPYAILTILPNIHLNCPYGTPLSSVTWRISQLSVIIYLQIILKIRKSFSQIWSLVNRQAHESQGSKCTETLEKQVKIRQQWFSQGLLRSVELSAYRADSTVVTKALDWTLTALDEDKEIEDFAARIPGFFNSRVVPDATLAVLSLMSHEPTADPIFGSRLCDLLKTCLPETSVLDEHTRKNRLRVCLNCLWHFGRAYNQPGIYESLPLYFSNALVPEITRRVQVEEDFGVRMMGRCFEALIVNKLAADLDSRVGSVKCVELACLSLILGIKSHDTTLYLNQPNTVALANVISFSFEKIGTISNTFPSYALDVVQQTLDILSRSFSGSTTQSTGLHFDQPIPIICGSDGKFETILLSRLHDLLNACQLATFPPTTELDVRTSRLRLCLRGLWYFGRAFNLLGIDLPSDIYLAFLNSEMTHTQSYPDTAVRAIGHCALSLIVNKLAADIDARTLPINDAELACLSTILKIDKRDVTHMLSHPGAIQFAIMSFLMTDTIYDALLLTSTPYVSHVVEQTFNILSRTLPAQLDAEMQLGLTDTLVDISKGTSPSSDAMRNKILDMFLKNLWHFTKLGIASGDSTPLPPHLYLSFTPPVTHFFLEGSDIVARVTRRCVGALIVNKLVADIKLGTIPANDAELVCLSTILHSESRDVRLCLTQPGVIELVNVASFVLGHVHSFKAHAELLDLREMLQHTLGILSQAVSPQENTEIHADQEAVLSHISHVKRTIAYRLHGLLATCMSNASPLAEEVRTGCLRMCLKILWYSSKAYHRTPDSLPPYFPLTLASPEMIHSFQTEQDPVARLTGCCFGALIASKLIDTLDLETFISFSSYDQDAERVCISAILGTKYRDTLLWPDQLRIINFRNIVSLILSEIDTLFTDSEGMPVVTLQGNMLLVHTIKVTLCILAECFCDTRFIPSWQPMDKQQLLQKTYSDVEDAFGLHRSKHETVNALDRLQKKLVNLLPVSIR